MALTPGRTKSRRVRRRAIELFRTGCELKTRGRTGVLLYLSPRRAPRRDRRRRGDRQPGRARGLGRGDGGPGRRGEGRAGRAPGMAGAVEKIGAVLIADPAAQARQSQRARRTGWSSYEAGGRGARGDGLGRPLHRRQAARQMGICLAHPRHPRRGDPRGRRRPRAPGRAISGAARAQLPGAARRAWSATTWRARRPKPPRSASSRRRPATAPRG